MDEVRGSRDLNYIRVTSAVADGHFSCSIVPMSVPMPRLSQPQEAREISVTTLISYTDPRTRTLQKRAPAKKESITLGLALILILEE